MLKKIREEEKKPVAILLDTKGPEIRTGVLKDGKKVLLKEGETITLTNEEIEGDETKVSLTYKGLVDDVQIGNMILIDDEEEPSINGTGAEDYFNHAWGMQRNQSPYNGTIMHDGDTKGYQVSYRFHLTDPIHFKKHIQISMEHGHANHLSDDWSCTAYWYQAAPVTSVTIQPVEERIPLKRTFDIPKPAHQVELTPEMQEAYRSRNERMEKFKVEKAEQIRLNAARTAPSETGNKELAHKVKKEFDKEK